MKLRPIMESDLLHQPSCAQSPGNHGPAHRPPSRRAGRRGVAAVEAAVTLPLLMTLLLGVWEVGRMLEINATMTNAVREGVRFAAGGVWNGQPVTVAMVEQQVKDYLTAAGFPPAAVDGAVVTVTNLSGSSWINPCDASPLDHFRVTVTIPPGTAYASLQWSPLSTMTGTNSMTVSADWLSVNDSLVTVNAQLPY
jgi:Flp pilus assembly protein TadG